jgi:hypothetical protein
MSHFNYSSGYNAAHFVSKTSENTYTPGTVPSTLQTQNRLTGGTLTPKYVPATSSLSKVENESSTYMSDLGKVFSSLNESGKSSQTSTGNFQPKSPEPVSFKQQNKTMPGSFISKKL